jgi:cell wall-associated NlpC family hydrolase
LIPALARAVTVLVLLLTAVAWLVAAPAAHAAALSAGMRILDRAETRTGDWYAYGAAGPSAFDCSGLVYWAATTAGEHGWPRDTYGIAAQIGTRFSITTRPERGDLALWGPVSAPYHVEIVGGQGQTFGAQSTGTRVGWHSDAWFRPSFYLHVNY